MKEKRILIVSDCIFYPQNEGNSRRIYNVIRIMQLLGYIVDFLYYASERSAYTKQMKDFLGKEHYFFFQSLSVKNSIFCRKSKGVKWERFVPSNRVDIRYSSELNKKVNSLIRKNRYSIIWLEYLYQSKLLESIDDSVIKVIDTHDRFAYRNYKLFPFIHRVVDYSVTFSGERKALGRADYVIAIQNEEEKYFRKLLKGKKTNVITIGDNHNIVKNEIPKSHDICFCGSGNRLNVDALNWFINEIFPMIVSQIKDCRLIVAGRICEKIDVGFNENVCLLGIVENLDVVYENCRIVVNPIRVGTGLNIKSIEAIAHCKPLVSTSVGARGLKWNKPIISVADDESKFAEKVICLLEEDSLCEKYRNNCIKFMEEYNKNNLEAMKMVISCKKRKN